MAIKNELDEWAVPKQSRYPLFKWGLAGGWSAFGVVLVLLMRCYSQREQIQEKRTSDWQEIARDAKEAARAQVRESLPGVTAEITQYQHKVDSLVKKLDSLTQKKTL